MSPLGTVPREAERRIYKDGETRLSSVTTIIEELDKPALDRWRVNKALDGIDPYGEDKPEADTGTLAHAAIAWALDPAHFEYPDTLGYRPDVIAGAVSAFKAWKEWYAANEFEPVHLEFRMGNKALGYGGTLDAFGKLNGKMSVLDWKTSKRIYAEYFVQTAAYAKLLAACTEYQAQEIRIVILDKSIKANADGDWFTPEERPFLFDSRAIQSDGSPEVSRPHFAVFEAARLVHEQRLAWNRKGGDPSS